jgi:hypothetical protein
MYNTANEQKILDLAMKTNKIFSVRFEVFTAVTMKDEAHCSFCVDVSEERIASIFRIEESARQEPA